MKPILRLPDNSDHFTADNHDEKGEDDDHGEDGDDDDEEPDTDDDD